MKYQVTLTFVIDSSEELTKKQIVEEIDWAFPWEYRLVDSRLVVGSDWT